MPSDNTANEAGVQEVVVADNAQEVVGPEAGVDQEEVIEEQEERPSKGKSQKRARSSKKKKADDDTDNEEEEAHEDTPRSKKGKKTPPRDFALFLQAMLEGQATICAPYGEQKKPMLWYGENVEDDVYFYDLNVLAFFADNKMTYPTHKTYSRTLAHFWKQFHVDSALVSFVGTEDDTASKYPLTPAKLNYMKVVLQSLLKVWKGISAENAKFAAVTEKVLEYLCNHSMMLKEIANVNMPAYSAHSLLLSYTEVIDNAITSKTRAELDSHLETLTPMLNGFSHLIGKQVEDLERTFDKKDQILRMAAVKDMTEIKIAQRLGIPISSDTPIQDFLRSGHYYIEFLRTRARVGNIVSLPAAAGSVARAVTAPNGQQRSRFPSLNECIFAEYRDRAIKKEDGTRSAELDTIRPEATDAEKMVVLNLCYRKYTTTFTTGDHKEKKVTDEQVLASGYTKDQFKEIYKAFSKAVVKRVDDLVCNGKTFTAKSRDGGSDLLPSITFKETIRILVQNMFKDMTPDADVDIPSCLLHIPADMEKIMVGGVALDSFISGVLAEFMNEVSIRKNAVGCLNIYIPSKDMAEHLLPMFEKEIPDVVPESVRRRLEETIICMLFLAASGWTDTVENYMEHRKPPAGTVLFIKDNTPTEIFTVEPVETIEVEARAETPATPQDAGPASAPVSAPVIPQDAGPASAPASAPLTDSETMAVGALAGIVAYDVEGAAQTLQEMHTQAAGGSLGMIPPPAVNAVDPVVHLTKLVMAEIILPKKGKCPTEEDYASAVDEITRRQLASVAFQEEDLVSVETMLLKFTEEGAIEWGYFYEVIKEMKEAGVDINHAMRADIFINAVVQCAYEKIASTNFPHASNRQKMGLRAYNDRKQAIINETLAEKNRAARQASSSAQ